MVKLSQLLLRNSHTARRQSIVRMLTASDAPFRILFSTQTDTSKSSIAKCFPNPTWSIADLRLDQNHEPMSQGEIEVLAKRALIDLDEIDPQEQLHLRQDLGNMMHMIHQISEFFCPEMDSLTDTDIYDAPRGVTETPVRHSSKPTSSDEHEAKQVWESYLKHQTKHVGAHTYFEIATRQKVVSVEKSDKGM